MKTLLRDWLPFVLANGLLVLPANWLLRDEGQPALLTLEVVLALALWGWAASRLPRRLRQIGAALLGLAWLLALAWAVYAAVLPGLFMRPPNLADDWLFARNLPFLLEALNLKPWAYAAAALGAALLLAGLFALGWTVARRAERQRKAWSALALLALLGWLLPAAPPASPRRPVTSLSAQAAANLQRSRATRADRVALLTLDPWQAYDYRDWPLEERPDVYLIFIESYGSALYRRADFRSRYLPLAEDFQARLQAEGWSAVSGLSTSPVWGGGSWMAYTSLLFGLQVNSETAYDALRARYDLAPYPNLIRYFQAQGYHTRWFVPIARRLTPAHEAADAVFYGPEEFIYFDDMDYHGPLYGWGPSPPDQYTLGLIGETARQSERPVLTVFLTQSTHYPWAPLPPKVDDWRELATLDLEGGQIKENNYTKARTNYLNAVTYTYQVLADFLQTVDEDALVILIGDHQPPTITNRKDGYETLMHVLSRDADFLAGWEAYGFTPGLILDDWEGSTLVHAGFYSLLVRQLTARYGAPASELPPYLPNGLEFALPLEDPEK